MGVLEGDVQGSMDADRIAGLHIPVVQLNTGNGFGGECHLDANMVRSAIPDIDLAEIDLLVIENVGNLVCPAEFRIGEDVRAMITSVTEGEDKPLKYPLMFRACELVVVNKVDLLPHLDFDVERLLGKHRDRQSGRTDDARLGEDRRRGSRVPGLARGDPAARRGARLSPPAPALSERVDELTRVRTRANRAFFEAQAEPIARCCHRMAERFARAGRLIAFGATPLARSDARHVAVEFVHPVIVGKRALPAIGLASEGGDLEAQARAACEPDDIAIAFGCEEEGPGAESARAALALARERGCLTIAFGAGSGAEWDFALPAGLDPFVRQELAETLYHLLWELVHVFFDHRGLLEGRDARPIHDPGASSFLYPFLSEAQSDLEPVVADVRSSALLKAEEIEALRVQTLSDNRGELSDAAAALRALIRARGRLLAFGNGGSATDAMDLVADFRAPLPDRTGEPRRALDLTEDTSIITAVANDVGVEAIFQRQVIAHGRPGDAAIALSTSGNSLNIIAALAEARRREMATIALVGYDGGQIAAERAGGPRDHHALPAHPSHPGSAGERLPRPARAR